ncbi:hypothetical protein [Helicobacter pylori]|uniref:hypothetical protein n=1 Tax=Helicobacter pylori TaxID=210 RepID=UPI0009A36014|nr:hypothetical protein [Helicobacter pylori]NHA58133.1 hypothetical protein [Helicobacter pylori]OPG27105.1 hypothetical protein BGL59_07775 [Helicobacter pylori]
MLLNYDFLERMEGSKVRAIDEKMKFLHCSNSIDRLILSYKMNPIKGSTIESTNLSRVVSKIKSGLPFGTISAFRPFKPEFITDFTEEEREKLIEAYKIGYKHSKADRVTKNWNDDPNSIDAYYDADAFLRGNGTIYAKLCKGLGKPFVNKFLNPKSETPMKGFMSSKEFVKRYRYTSKDNMERTRQLKSFLNFKRDFLGCIEVVGYWKESLKDGLLTDKETSFFVFQNEPSDTFNLKKTLLVLARAFSQAAICYCQNASANEVDLIGAEPGSYGEVWDAFNGIAFSAPVQLSQFLTRLKDKVYTFFKKQPNSGYGTDFGGIAKTQIKAAILPIDRLSEPFESYIVGSIKGRQNMARAYGYPKVFTIDEVSGWEKETIKSRDYERRNLSKTYRLIAKQNLEIIKISNALAQGKSVSVGLIASVLNNANKPNNK